MESRGKNFSLVQVHSEPVPEFGHRVFASVLRHPAVSVLSARVRIMGYVVDLVEMPPKGSDARICYAGNVPFSAAETVAQITVIFRNGPRFFASFTLQPCFTLLSQATLEPNFAWRRLRSALMRARLRVADLWKSRKTHCEFLSSLFWRSFLTRFWIRWVQVAQRTHPLFYHITNPERIGHLASEPEIFFSEAKLGYHNRKARYCFVFLRDSWVEDIGCVRTREKVDRFHLFKMLKRRHFVVGMNREHFYSLPWKHIHSNRAHGQRDIHGSLDLTEPQLSFTKAEIRKGWSELKKLGLDASTPFVCLHLRESGYIRSLYKDHSPPEARYAYRDVGADSYIPMIEYLIREGFRVVRMGVPPVENLNINDPFFIDYASRAQSSFLDLFLCANCQFFVGTTSGLYALADLFRRPTVLTNFAPLRHIHSWSARNLILPKTAWHRTLGRALSFEEMLLKGFGDIIHGEKISHLPIDYIPNTSGEILAAVGEMVDRIHECWRDEPGDEGLQREFWSLLPRDELNKTIRARVSAHFLRKYRTLLPPTLFLDRGSRETGTWREET